MDEHFILPATNFESGFEYGFEYDFECDLGYSSALPLSIQSHEAQADVPEGSEVRHTLGHLGPGATHIRLPEPMSGGLSPHETPLGSPPPVQLPLATES